MASRFIASGSDSSVYGTINNAALQDAENHGHWQYPQASAEHHAGPYFDLPLSLDRPWLHAEHDTDIPVPEQFDSPVYTTASDADAQSNSTNAQNGLILYPHLSASQLQAHPGSPSHYGGMDESLNTGLDMFAESYGHIESLPTTTPIDETHDRNLFPTAQQFQPADTEVSPAFERSRAVKCAGGTAQGHCTKWAKVGKSFCARHYDTWLFNNPPLPKLGYCPNLDLQAAQNLIFPLHQALPNFRADTSLAIHLDPYRDTFVDKEFEDQWVETFIAMIRMPHVQDPRNKHSAKYLDDQQRTFYGKCATKSGIPTEDYGEVAINARMRILFHSIVRFYLGGPALMPVGGSNGGYGKPDLTLNFEERLNAIGGFLRLDKRLAMDVIEDRGVLAFVANPIKFANRKKQNQKSNAKKAARVEKQRAQTSDSAADEEEALSEPDRELQQEPFASRNLRRLQRSRDDSNNIAPQAGRFQHTANSQAHAQTDGHSSSSQAIASSSTGSKRQRANTAATAPTPTKKAKRSALQQSHETDDELVAMQHNRPGLQLMSVNTVGNEYLHAANAVAADSYPSPHALRSRAVVIGGGRTQEQRCNPLNASVRSSCETSSATPAQPIGPGTVDEITENAHQTLDAQDVNLEHLLFEELYDMSPLSDIDAELLRDYDGLGTAPFGMQRPTTAYDYDSDNIVRTTPAGRAGTSMAR